VLFFFNVLYFKNMPYELPKSQKKIAREIIEKGLLREYQNGIEKVEAVIGKWKSGKLDNREAYISIYKKLTFHNKHLARRYDNMSGSKYLIIISGQVADGVIAFEELSELNDQARQVIQNWLDVIEGD
jgi:enamine deaminase RidA (YjgF/YER057c/UK114 family)